MNETPKKQTKTFHQVTDTKSRIDSKATIIDPIDYSFRDLMHFEEISDSHPRFKDEPKKQDGKYLSLGLKLGYNALRDVNGLYDWSCHSFAYPNQISTIDLSFNCLTNIPPDLVKFEGLTCLYLHGNKLTDLSEIELLKQLKNLTTFTIHGNPVENLSGFRFYILSKLPNLKHLNFSGLSKKDRQNALIYVKSNKINTKVNIGGESKQTKKSGSDDES